MFICKILETEFCSRKILPELMNEPLNGPIRVFNEFLDLFEFGVSKDGSRV
jgi:hypothetical protein